MVRDGMVEEVMNLRRRHNEEDEAEETSLLPLLYSCLGFIVHLGLLE